MKLTNKKHIENRFSSTPLATIKAINLFITSDNANL